MVRIHTSPPGRSDLPGSAQGCRAGFQKHAGGLTGQLLASTPQKAIGDKYICARARAR